jgi:electron transfer flavoprotein alpha subunit
MSDLKHVLVVQDTENLENSINLLALIQTMYAQGTYQVTLLSFQDEVGLVDGYFHQIITAPKVPQGALNLPGMSEVVEKLHNQNNYDSILIPATRTGRMLAPRMARRLHTGLVADVNDIAHMGDRLLMIRTAYSGNILAGITSVGNGPIMMSVHPDAFSYTGKKELQSKIRRYGEPIRNTSTLCLLEREEKPKTYDIRKSEILVSGGGGVKRDFALLQQLAETLGGTVSASRKLVDQGIAPRSIQVGQSGKIVSPRLYIALGINGAIQHVEGLRDIETIISVNTSAKAPICSLSDIVVEGDAKDFIEKLLLKIHNNQHTQEGET